MKVKVDLDIAQIIKGRLDDEAKLFLANTAYKLMNDYIPMDTGSLAQTVDLTPEYLHFKVPYAEKMYEGDQFHFRKDKHPLATAHWDKAMMDARGDKLRQTMQNYMDKRG